MISAISAVELAGPPRLAINAPPTGILSGVCTKRLRRCFHQSRSERQLSPFASPESKSTINYADLSGRGKPAHNQLNVGSRGGQVAEAQSAFLRQLFFRYRPMIPSNPANLSRAIDRGSAIGAGKDRDTNSWELTKSGTGTNLEQHGTVDTLPEPFNRAMAAMQQRDSRKLLIALKQIVAISDEDLQDAVAALPRTTFSEFLRSLDPIEIGPENDPTDGVYVSPGMWQVLNMEHVMDDFGVRRIYIRLLQRMLCLMDALHKSGQALHVNDYVPLLRAAGSASDITGAKVLWRQLDQSNAAAWRHSDLFNEFVRSRMLVDPRYYGYDKTRIMMKPRNLHRAGLQIRSSVPRLDRLRVHLRNKTFLFGLNKNVPYSEDLARELRKRKPITRIFKYALTHGLVISDELLCTLMTSFGRAGSIRFIQYHILEDWYGVTFYKDSHGQVHVRDKPPRKVMHKDPSRPFLPRMKPTARLLHTIAEVYCSNGQLSMAFHLIDYISKRYNIPIPAKTWTELLAWTHVLSSTPTASAWKMAGLWAQVPDRRAVEMVWQTMTSPPYNVQPSFEHYDAMIMSLIARRDYTKALEFLEAARGLYDAQSRAYEEATFEYIRTLRDGVEPTPSLRAFQRARFLKQYMWYRISQSCHALLSKFRTTHLDSETANRQIPNVIRNFRPFIRNPALYRTATGYVQLTDPAEYGVRKVGRRDVEQEVAVKMRRSGWVLQRMRKTYTSLLGLHSLADQRSSRLDPWVLLGDSLASFRPLTKNAVVLEREIVGTSAGKRLGKAHPERTQG